MMKFEFCSFSSGSSGNSYLIKTETTNIIIDVGISGKKILTGLDHCQLKGEDIDAILVTHEHMDHMVSLRTMSKKAPTAKIFASEGTKFAMNHKTPEVAEKVNLQEQDFFIGDIQVKPFALSHDAEEPTGYSFFHKGKQLSIVTDTGCITTEIHRHIATADFLVLESNHEVNILKCGPYPYSLKRRILSDYGHLSNEAAAICLCELLSEQKRKVPPRVFLGHLSSENNSPFQARMTVENTLFQENLLPERDFNIDILIKNQVTGLIEV